MERTYEERAEDALLCGDISVAAIIAACPSSGILSFPLLEALLVRIVRVHELRLISFMWCLDVSHAPVLRKRHLFPPQGMRSVVPGLLSMIGFLGSRFFSLEPK